MGSLGGAGWAGGVQSKRCFQRSPHGEPEKHRFPGLSLSFVPTAAVCWAMQWTKGGVGCTSMHQPGADDAPMCRDQVPLRLQSPQAQAAGATGTYCQAFLQMRAKPQ
jgi:hypothetical protein